MMTPSLKIAGIDLSIISWLDFDQSIEPIGGSTVRRMANGAAFKLTHYRKHRISLSASGWIPAPINAVNYDAPFEIELPIPLAFRVGESLPAGWSSRAAPWGEYSTVDQNGVSVRMIYPKMTVISDGPRSANGHGASPSWELICEVV